MLRHKNAPLSQDSFVHAEREGGAECTCLLRYRDRIGGGREGSGKCNGKERRRELPRFLLFSRRPHPHVRVGVREMQKSVCKVERPRTQQQLQQLGVLQIQLGKKIVLQVRILELKTFKGNLYFAHGYDVQSF